MYPSLDKRLGAEEPMPPPASNLFVDLGERVAAALNITNCWVCGGASMSEQWPWEATELIPGDPRLWNHSLTIYPEDHPHLWTLLAPILGTTCIERCASVQFSKPVGNTACTSSLIVNDTLACWWSNDNSTLASSMENPYSTFPVLSHLWVDPGNISLSWRVPEGMFWICGLTAYSRLPKVWSGSCVLGAIRPGFSLHPKSMGDSLGVSIYDYFRRTRQSIEIGGTQVDGEWPPDWIIKYYGPATWAQDGSYGY